MRTEKVRDILLALPLFVAPIIYGWAPDLMGPFLVSLLAAAVFVITASNLSTKHQNASQVLLVFLPLIGFIALAGFNQHSYSWINALGVAAALLYGLVVSGFLDLEGRQIAVFSVIAGAWCSACVFLGAVILFPNTVILEIALRNPNTLAMHLILILPIVYSRWRLAPQGKEKGFYALLGSVMVLALLLSESMGAWVALLLAAALITLRKKWIGFLAVLLLVTLIIFFKQYVGFDSYLARWYWIQSAWAIFLDFPLLGSAFEGGFLALYPMYKLPGALPENSIFVHNLYLELLCRWGILAAMLLAFAIYRLRKLMPRHLAKSYFVAFLGVGLMSLVDSSLLALPNMLAFSILLFCTLTKQRVSKSSVWRPVLTWSACACLAIWLVFSGLKMTVAHFYLLRAGIWANTVDYVSHAYAETYHSIVKSIRWNGHNPAAWSDLGKMEAGFSHKQPFRIARAIWFERQALRVNRANGVHLRNLKFLYSMRDKLEGKQ